MIDDVMLHLKLLFCSVAARNAWKKRSLKEAFLSGSDDHLIRHQMAGHSDGVWQQFHLCSGNEKIPVWWPKSGKSPSEPELKDTLRRPKLFSIAAAQVEVKEKSTK